MATAALNRYTPEEYFALEDSTDERYEYIDGQIVAMSGAERPHNLLVTALTSRLEVHLADGPCEVYSSSQRVGVSASGAYLFPDVAVACEPRFEAVRSNLLTPLLIIEVLSDSTEKRDRGRKFELYKQIDTLQEYVLVTQTEIRVERYSRAGEFWPREVLTDPDASLVLASVGLEIPLSQLYRKALVPTSWVTRGPERVE